MDIGSGSGYPAGNLSNFHPYQFEIDGVTCNSMEGFLQSLKFSNPVMQEYVCSLVKGKKKKWFKDQTLYWRGNPIKRDSEEYQDLLDRAFDALATNKKFQKTLLDTHNATLTHAMGKKKNSETVLTTQEFCSRLTKIREQLRQEG